MMRRRPPTTLLFLVLLGAALAAGCGDVRPVELAIEGETMGTTWSVRAVASASDRARLQDGIARVLAEVDEAMSTWKPESEISRFNAYGGTDWFAVSPGTAEVLAEAREISARTGGAFDVTVGPLVDLWGFGSAPQRAVPTDAAIDAVRARVGWRGVEVRRAPPALRKARPELAVDLSGIAKGHAIDRVLAFLASAGCEDALVEVGGEVRVRGHHADGSPWRVGVERPTPDAPALQRTVALTDHALATSGDYRRFVMEGGRRLPHIVDPRTGRPIGHALAAATVVAPRAASADAWATALMVLGPEEGLALARREGLAVLLLVRDGDRIVERRTPAFARMRDAAPASSAPQHEESPVGLVAAALIAMLGTALMLGLSRARPCGRTCTTCTDTERASCRFRPVRFRGEPDEPHPRRS